MWSRFRIRSAVSSSFLRFFSSSSSGEVESIPYRLSMLRRPVTVSLRGLPWNSCSFVGSVIAPVRRFAGVRSGSRAYTFLEVEKASPRSNHSDRSSFQYVISSAETPYSVRTNHVIIINRILLALDGKMAEISLKHLKQNDLVYVSGCLSSYEKVDKNGSPKIFYKVAVEDLSYIYRNNQTQTSGKSEASATVNLTRSSPNASALREEEPSQSSDLEKARDRLHLWQVFFANPREWWDNRLSKLSTKGADFKHKHTEECLWIQADDPPWVRRQLELFDSKITSGSQSNNGGHFSRGWKAKDFEKCVERRQDFKKACVTDDEIQNLSNSVSYDHAWERDDWKTSEAAGDEENKIWRQLFDLQNAETLGLPKIL